MVWYITNVIDEEGNVLPFFGVLPENLASDRVKETAIDVVEELPKLPEGSEGPMRLIKNELNEYDWEDVPEGIL